MQRRTAFTSSLIAGAVLCIAALTCDRTNEPAVSPSAVAANQPTASPSTGAVVERGAHLYQRYCALCHGKEATGYAADNAPSLVSQTFLESASDAFIAAGIRSGRPNTAMAAYGTERGGPLDDAQIHAIVRFLRSKGPAPKPLPRAPLTGNPNRGAALFAEHCQTCHGTATERGTALHLHNPELLATASPAFFRHAVIHGRPPTAMPAFEDQLGDEHVNDLVAWFMSLKRQAKPAPAVTQTTVPDDLPMVINPNGSRPQFTLRAGRFVSADQVKQALDQKQRLIIVDARPPSDWIQFHIPGAVPVPYHDEEKLARIPNDGTWVVAYCACPHHASGVVVDALRAKNYPNTAVLDEGILVWRKRGYPLAGEAMRKP